MLELNTKFSQKWSGAKAQVRLHASAVPSLIQELSLTKAQQKHFVWIKLFHYVRQTIKFNKLVHAPRLCHDINSNVVLLLCQARFINYINVFWQNWVPSGSEEENLWFDSGTMSLQLISYRAAVEPNCNLVWHSRSMMSELGLSQNNESWYKYIYCLLFWSFVAWT